MSIDPDDPGIAEQERFAEWCDTDEAFTLFQELEADRKAEAEIEAHVSSLDDEWRTA